MRPSFLPVILIALCLAWAASAFAATRSYTLEESFSAALKRSETIGINTELVTQAEERYKQARGAVFPSINGVASYLIQEQPPSGTATSFSPSEQTLVKLTATQGIFHGMQEYAAISQQNDLVTAQMSARRDAAAQLYSDMAINFYTILMLEKQLANYENEVKIYRDRTAELNHRIKIGRSQKSEVLSVQSALDTLLAQVEKVKGQLEAEREAYHFLTTFSAQSNLEETPPVNPRLKPLHYYLGRIEDRPDVKSAKDQAQAADKSVTIARAGHFPSVDAVADYYFKRPGLTKEQHWDVQLVGTIPIFAGGAVNARVREAASIGRQSELALSRARRSADEQIRSLYVQVQSDLEQAARLDRSAQSAFASYQAQTKDYKLGLATNLDVLQAITTSQEAKRALDNARYQSKLDFLRLEIAAAIRPLGNEGDFKYE